MSLLCIYLTILVLCIGCFHARVTVGNIYDDIDSLKRELVDLRKNNEDAKKDYDKMKQSYEDLNKNNVILQQSNTDLKKSFNDLNNSNVDLKNSFNDLRNSNVDLQHSNDDLRKSYNELIKSYDDLNKSNAGIEKSNNGFKKNYDDLYKSYAGTNEELRKSFDALNESNTDLMKRNVKLQSGYDDLLKINADLTRKDEDLKKKDEEIQKQNEAHTVEVNKLKAVVAKQNISLSEVIIQSSKLSTFCRSLSKDICGQCSCLDDPILEHRYYCDCQHHAPKRDCLDFYTAGYQKSGIYRVTLNLNQAVQVYCEQEKDGGGWTVIQRRLDNTTKFFRNWAEYKKGFGSLHRSFWLGNDNLYLLTLQAAYPRGSELRIDMSDWYGNTFYSKYSSIFFDKEERDYAIRVSGYSGNGGDGLSSNNNHRFTTWDKYDDCATSYHAAWWSCCYYSNLNGVYFEYDHDYPVTRKGITWYYYSSDWRSMKTADMKVRRKT